MAEKCTDLPVLDPTFGGYALNWTDLPLLQSRCRVMARSLETSATKPHWCVINDPRPFAPPFLPGLLGWR